MCRTAPLSHWTLISLVIVRKSSSIARQSFLERQQLKKNQVMRSGRARANGKSKRPLLRKAIAEMEPVQGPKPVGLAEQGWLERHVTR